MTTRKIASNKAPVVFETEGTIEEVKTSPDLGIYLSLNYEGGETVQVLSVSEPKTPVEMKPEILASIGTCAGLLSE